MGDKLLFISTIPLTYAPVTSILRAASFYPFIKQIAFRPTSEQVNVSSRSSNNRLVDLFFSNLVICVFIAGLQMLTADANGISGMFDLDGEINSSSSTKSSDFIIFLQYFYSTVDSFTSTGNNNNMRPTSVLHILLHIVLCVLGRYYFVTFLAFGKNTIRERIDNIHIDYSKCKTRIVNYMKKAGCHETSLGERKTSYIINTLEGLYLKTKFLDEKILKRNIMPGLNRKFSLLEYGDVMRETR